MSWTTRLGAFQSRHAVLLLLIGVSMAASGCTALVSPIDAIPADRLPAQFLVAPRANKVPIDLARLRQETPDEYLLDAGDILGVSIESILGKEGEPPPFHFPEQGSDLPPAIGYPIPVREDGTVSLPLVPPVPVRGLTLTQAREVIRKAYMEDMDILKEDRIIVTLIRERRIRVIVVRQDGVSSAQNAGNGQVVNSRSDLSGRGFTLDLPAYKNDLLHALAETGGLPGVNAKNEVKIMRGTDVDFRERDRFVQEFYQQHYNDADPCYCPPPLPEDANVLRIPLRLNPGEVPSINEQDIILNDGDIVYVESRETEVFYTGGLLPGGEHPLPRDYDLDVLAAVAMSRGAIGAQSQGNGGGGGIGGSIQGIGGAPPSELIILRKLPCNQQVAISVNLNDAINDPSSRLLVAPGDTLILRYRPREEVLNFGLGSFFTFGIRELFRN